MTDDRKRIVSEEQKRIEEIRADVAYYKNCTVEDEYDVAQREDREFLLAHIDALQTALKEAGDRREQPEAALREYADGNACKWHEGKIAREALGESLPAVGSPSGDKKIACDQCGELIVLRRRNDYYYGYCCSLWTCFLHWCL